MKSKCVIVIYSGNKYHALILVSGCGVVADNAVVQSLSL